MSYKLLQFLNEIGGFIKTLLLRWCAVSRSVGAELRWHHLSSVDELALLRERDRLSDTWCDSRHTCIAEKESLWC